MISMEELENKYAVEYSIKQKCFNIEELSRVLKINRANVANKTENCWLLLAICDSWEEARKFANAYKPGSGDI